MTEEVTETPEAAASEPAQAAPQFQVKKLYIKDISFEIPSSPEVFNGEYKPEIKLDMNSRSKKISDNDYEVVLNISLTATQDEKTMFLVEVQQAGIFTISGLTEELQMRHALTAYCPNILFPYVRETISGLVSKGGFPPLLLAPVNFDQLFNAQLQQEQAQAAQKTEGETEQ